MVNLASLNIRYQTQTTESQTDNRVVDLTSSFKSDENDASV